MLKVGGGRTPWPAGHVARLAGHHLACCNPSLDPYKYPSPLPVEIKATHSTCSSPLVKVWFQVVAQAKPYRESRVKSRICSGSESSLRDR
jgi:hypothetical protein